MNLKFESLFAERIIGLVEQKRRLGFSYSVSEYYLSQFDMFCMERFPNEAVLTKEICLTWAVKRGTEQNNGFRNRLAPVREFAKYLVRNGELAYVIPPHYVRRGARGVPYIYTETEIASIWQCLDEITPCPHLPARHLVIPAIIRILYCCGLRPGEACKLKTSDVDLKSGKVFVRESKGHKDRIVMLADDVNNYYCEYNKSVCRLLPNREWFFPSGDNAYTVNVLDKAYRDILNKTDIGQSSYNLPILYGFRHTFATHRLYQWLREGKDLTSMLPYLSAYMGHARLSDTYYYIHFVPEQFQTMSGLDFTKYEALLPEVECYD